MVEASQLKSPEFPRRWPMLCAVVGLGVAIRLTFLALSGELELWADEAHYVQLAAMWSRFGFYMGSPAYLWPPVYPAFITPFVSLFGEHGITAAKLCQVLLSGLIGASVVLLAIRLFSYRAAIVSGLLWAGYLPLIGYTHYLWPETLFLCFLLPAVYLFTNLLGSDLSPRQTRIHLVLVGALLGGAILTKEVALPLPLLFGLVYVGFKSRDSRGLRLIRAALLVASTVVIVMPWSLRNAEVYGRWIVGGSTLGRNMLWGVNAKYVNFDYTKPGMAEILAAQGPVRRWLIEPPQGLAWKQSRMANRLDQSKENVYRALEFVRLHPGFYLRSRIKRLADWATPMSFFDRHYRLGLYQDPLDLKWVRRTLITLSVLSTMLIMAGALPGLFWTLRAPEMRTIFLVVFLTCLPSVLMAAMSRYRVPVEPLMLVLTGGFLASGGEMSSARRWERGIVVSGWVALTGLWLVNAKEVWIELSRVW
jgi:4-amino-4-deoxy-L-arabinose transferase-like glycosyltransferase